MQGLRVYEKNLPDQIREGIKQSRSLAAITLIEGLERSISENDFQSFLALWIPATHRFIDAYKFSKKELQIIITLLYERLLKSDLSLDGLQMTLSILNRLLKFKKRLALSFDWKELFSLYENLQNSSKYILYSKVQLTGIITELATTIRKVKKYFSAEAKNEVIDKFQKMISPAGDINSALVYICNFLPNKGQGECTWVPLLIDLLKTKQRNLNLLINTISCLAITAKNYPQYDWSLYLPELYNIILPSLPLLPNTLPRPKTYYSETSKTSPFIQKFMSRSSSFARLVSFTLSHENFFLLEQWLQNMRSTIKEGKMISGGYINYISRIISNYCKRIRKNHSQIPENLTERLVSLILPYVSLIFYSGHLSQIDRFCTDLAYLLPNITIPFLIERSFSIFEDSNIPHLDSVVVLERIIRPMLEPTNYTKGFEHLPLIMNATLAEFTSADMLKSCKVLDLYGQVASGLELNHDIDGISIWADNFFKHLLEVLQELEENSETKAEKNRNYKIEETLELNLQIICSAISEDIFQAWVDDFLDFVKRNNCNNAIDEFSVIAKCLANRNSERIINELIKLVEVSLFKSENQLAWAIGLLSASLCFAGDFLIGKAIEIENLVTRLSDKQIEYAGNLLSCLVQGLLGSYPLSYSPYVPSIMEKKLDKNAIRGKISNQIENLEIEIQWRLPNNESVAISNALFERFLLKLPITKP